MMHLKLYKLKECDDYKIDKSSYLTQVGSELTGDIKEDCDISSPVITLSCPKDSNSNNIIDFNYCYITEFSRYYFINSITFGMGDIITISCSCDVLYSFMSIPTGVTSHWCNTNLYCTRRTNGENFIEDKDRSFLYKRSVTDITSTISRPTSTPYVEFDVSNIAETSYRVVLSCISDLPLATRNIMWAHGNIANFENLPALNERSNGGLYSTLYYVITLRSLTKVIETIYNNDALKSFIKSIIILPYTPTYTTSWYSTGETPTLQQIHAIFLGNGESIQNLPDYTGLLSYSNYERFIKETRYIPSATSFLDFAPYTSIKMYLPYKDYVELNLESVRGCRLSIIYYVNYDDASANVMVYNETNDNIEYQAQCQLGIKIGVSSTNQLEINNQKIQLGVSTAIGTITSIIGLASNNPLLVAGGVVGAIGTSANAVSKANAMIVTGETATSSGNVGVINNQNVQFIETKASPRFSSGTTFNTYKSDKGLPYMSYLKIDNAQTDEFLIFDDDNIPMDNRMTKNEFNTLVELLKKGVRK